MGKTKVLSRNTAWISHLPIQNCLTEYKKTNKHKLLNQSYEIMHMIVAFNYATLFNILFHFEYNKFCIYYSCKKLYTKTMVSS